MKQTPCARIVPASDKPLSEYTASERRIFRAPTVEERLRKIRYALALATAIGRVDQPSELLTHQALADDLSAAVADLCEEAWRYARELTDGFSGDVHNLRVISTESEGGDE